MKKKFLFLSAIAMLLTVAALCISCGNKPADSVTEELAEFQGITFNSATINYDGTSHEIKAEGIPENATVVYSGNFGTEVGTYNATATVSAEGYKETTYRATLKINPPTAETVVAARATAVDSNKENYDFRLHLQGSVNVGGFIGTANGYYDGKYRFDKGTSELSFERTTSGSLFYDSTEYIKTEGDSRIKLKTNDKGAVKSVSVIPKEEEGITMVNLPFVKIADALQASYFSEISLSDNDNYKFMAKLNFVDDSVTAGILGVLGKSDTKISIGNVAFTNPCELKFYFNLDSAMILNEFAFGAEIEFPIKGVQAGFSVTYYQHNGTGEVVMPSTVGLAVTESDIQRELNVINGAFATLRDSDVYSLETAARNEFDPGWNVKATVDKYSATIFKNTYELEENNFVAFNHSYECKTHLEDESAETYKYTLGNIQDGTVYKVSRTGKNKGEIVEGISVATQTNYFLNSFIYDVSDVDCIRKTVKDGATVYEIYLTDDNTIAVNETVADLINVNEEEGVKKVDNYFNTTKYDINDSSVTIEIKNGEIANAEVKTKIRYNPTINDYQDQIITLTDSISLTVNGKKDKAAEYKAPKNFETKLGSFGLNNAKFYIN